MELVKNWKFWDFVGWDTQEHRTQRNEHNNRYGLYTTIVIVGGLCLFGFIVWGN